MVCQHYDRRLRLSQSCSAPRALWTWLGVTPQRMILAGVFVAMILSGTVYGDDQLASYRIVNGAIPAPLTEHPGNPERGRRIVRDRDGGDCTICHAMPLPQREFHGTIGPPLDGIGSRATAGGLRLRLVDPKALNPATIMPAYYQIEGLYRVLDRYRARPILTAQQIEDIIAYLLTLMD